jgi:hypothetical protein
MIAKTKQNMDNYAYGLLHITLIKIDIILKEMYKKLIHTYARWVMEFLIKFLMKWIGDFTSINILEKNQNLEREE